MGKHIAGSWAPQVSPKELSTWPRTGQEIRPKSVRKGMNEGQVF